MKFLFIAITIASSLFSFGQDKAPLSNLNDNCLDINSPQKQELKADTIFKPNTEWQFIKSLDLLDAQNNIDEKSIIKVKSKKKLEYITKKDKLSFFNDNRFQIIYGGKGPEIDVFEIIEFKNNCMIIEVKGTSKGYDNGSLMWSRDYHLRFLLKKVVESNS